MTKIVNFATAAAFAVAALAVADTATADDRYNSYGAAKIIKEKHGKEKYKECKFVDKKGYEYKAEFVYVDYAGRSDHVKKLKCFFKNERKPAYEEKEEGFKCRVDVKTYDYKHGWKEKSQTTYYSYWKLVPYGAYGTGYMECRFGDEYHY